MNEISNIQTYAQKLADELQLEIVLPAVFGKEQETRAVLIGQPTQNLFGVLGEFIEGLEPLDIMILRGYHCTIRQGGSREFAILKDNDRLPVSVETLVSKLGEFSASPEMLKFEITLESPLLQGVALEVIASCEEFDDVDWPTVLSNTHYCLFTLSSAALLSLSERRVLRQRILPYTKDCLGILLTQDNLVPDDAREDIDMSLHNFIKGAAEAYRLPETDSEAVRQLFAGLTGRFEELEEKRLYRASAIQLRELLEKAELRMEVLSSDTEQLDDAIHALSAKAKLLPSRQESACRRARMQYIAKLKLEMNEKISAFHQELIEKLRSEIAASENIDDLHEVLPRYISDQWAVMMESVKNHIETALAEMSEGLAAYIEKDFKDFIQNGVDSKLSNYLFSVLDMYSPNVADGSMFRYQEVEDKSKLKSYSAIASGVALVLLAHPVIGIAVAVFGSKHFKSEGKRQFLENNKQALISAAEEMSREANDEAVTMLTQTFAAVEAKLADNVEESYQKMMDIMVQALNCKKQDRADYGEQLDALGALKTEAEQLLTET